MSYFREVEDPVRKAEIIARLPPPVYNVGDTVWWNGIWGEMYEGVVRCVDIGRYGSQDAYRIRAQSVRQYDARGEGKVYENTCKWESETTSERDTTRDHLWTFKSKKRAMKKAVEGLRQKSEELYRDARKFEAAATLMEGRLMEMTDD